MEADLILKEVHAIKDQLAREVNYDMHVLCERIRQTETRYASRLVKPIPDGAKGDAPATSRA